MSLEMNRAVEGIGVMERAVELTHNGESFVMATVVWRQGPSSGHNGSRAIITADGSVFGWIGGACAEPVLIREAAKVMESNKPQLIWLGQEADFAGMHVPDGVMTVPMACQSEGALQIYVEPMHCAPHVSVVGKSPMALTLVHLVEALDWRVDLIDLNDFDGSAISTSSIVVIATQGHGDEEAAEVALAHSPAYLGIVASRKRGEAILAYLQDRHCDQKSIDQIKIPAGLDLGHTSHREMAVSIVAELVALRASGSFTLRKEVSQKAITDSLAREAIDLVCGMMVSADISHRPWDFEGTTYYFCAPGCRSSFEKDPLSYINQEAKC
jgi:xanthine dehydrogenase accessory factor